MTDLFGQALAPASPSQPPARARRPMTNATCGLRGFLSSPSAALQQSLESRLRARTDVNGSLEYALMFMRTKAKDLHVNPFNGLYYKMQWTDKGITGKVFEVDMAPFIAPDIVPMERRKRPLQPQDFYEADLNSQWLPQLSIE